MYLFDSALAIKCSACGRIPLHVLMPDIIWWWTKIASGNAKNQSQ